MSALACSTAQAQNLSTATTAPVAAPTLAPNIVQGVSGGYQQQNSLSVWGVYLPKGVTDLAVMAFNTCRYMDNIGVDTLGTPSVFIPSAGNLHVPMKSDTEWKAFIQNAIHSGVKLDLCRLSKPMVYGAQTGKVDFAGGLSSLANLAPSTSVLDNSRFQAVSPDAPLKRIDTRSQGALDAFKSDEFSPLPHDFAMLRTDCLGPTLYPDGSTRNPCTTWSWIEQVTAHFKYDLGTYDNLGLLRTTANSPAAPLDPGNWLPPTFSRVCPSAPSGTTTGGGQNSVASASCPPAVNPPTLRNCPPQLHNTNYWVDTGTQTEAVACPSGQISDPTDPKRKTYMLQTQHLCFDSVGYPLTTTQHVNEQILGNCLPIVNGSCGPVNNTAVASAPASGLCASGSASVVAVQADGTYKWDCLGQNTGSDAHCQTTTCAGNTPYSGSCEAVGLVSIDSTNPGTVTGNKAIDICTPSTATWSTGSFGACSGACGGGTGIHARTVACSTGIEADCDPATKPAVTQSCVNNTACVYSGSWNAGAFGTCSGACGGGSGTQTRTVTCSTGNFANCDPATKPATSQACTNTTACPPVYSGSWVQGSFGACSGACGGGSGTQTRAVTCSTGNDADCDPALKPATSQVCVNTNSCGPTMPTFCYAGDYCFMGYTWTLAQTPVGQSVAVTNGNVSCGTDGKWHVSGFGFNSWVSFSGATLTRGACGGTTCGSADAAMMVTSPPSGSALCGSATASAVTGSGPYYWSCTSGTGTIYCSTH